MDVFHLQPLGSTGIYYRDQHGSQWTTVSFWSGRDPREVRCDLCGAPMTSGYRRPGRDLLIVCDAHVVVEDA